jgi:hypothetical protein
MGKKDIDNFKLALAEDKERFEKVYSSLGSLIANRKTKADQSMENDEDINSVIGLVYDLVGYCHSRIDSLGSRMYAVSDEIYSHANAGHLPKLNAGPMNKLLKVAGIDDSYEAAKKNVYCASASKNKVVEVNFDKS